MADEQQDTGASFSPPSWVVGQQPFNPGPSSLTSNGIQVPVADLLPPQAIPKQQQNIITDRSNALGSTPQEYVKNVMNIANSPEYKAARAPEMEQVKKLQDTYDELKPVIREDDKLVAEKAKEILAMGPPPKAIDQSFKDPLQVFSQIGPALAMLGSLRSRTPMIAAMNSAAAAMKAFHEGDVEKLKLELENHKQAVEEYRDKNKTLIDQYNALKEKKTMDLSSMEAFASGDQAMLEAIKSEGFDGAAKIASDFGKGDDALLKHLVSINSWQNKQEKDSIDLQIKNQRLKDLQQKSDYALTPDDADDIADYALKTGDHSLMAGFGRKPQDREMITKAFFKMGRQSNMDDNDIAQNVVRWKAELSEQTREGAALGTRVAGINLAIGELVPMGKEVVRTSELVPRTKLKNINDAIIAYETNTGDGGIIRFGEAIDDFQTMYARMKNPTGVPRIEDKNTAKDLLQKAYSSGQIKAGVDEVMNIAKIAKGGAENTVDEFKSGKKVQQAAPEGTVVYDDKGNKKIKKNDKWVDAP